MTELELLSITQPEKLFPGSKTEAQKLYRQLAKVWHPDVPGGNGNVFAHVHDLYQQALDRLNNGTWLGAGIRKFTDESGSIWTLQVRAVEPLYQPDGAVYLADDCLAYILTGVSAAKDGWAHWFQNAPGKFRYASNRMQTEFERCLPKIRRSLVLKSGNRYVEVAKTPDQIRLRDIVTHAGQLDPRHVAWITSRLLNLCCYLSHVGLVHQDISQDTVFISPPHHTAALLGGWFHYAQRGAPLRAVLKRTHSVLPYKVIRDKVASSQTDLELVRLTAREILKGSAPDPMQRWLETPGDGTAVEQYTQWMDVLVKSFGPRKFVPMLLDADTVYDTRKDVH